MRDHYILKIKTPKKRIWPGVVFFGMFGLGIGGYLGYNLSD
jgi:hypothetical protein